VLEPADPGQRTPTSPRKTTGATADENNPPPEAAPVMKKQDEKVGVITKLIRSGVYGFILCKDEEIFFHRSEIEPDDMVVGISVTFSLLEDPNRKCSLKAVNLRRSTAGEAQIDP
jgi:cold shock CspA family protein